MSEPNAISIWVPAVSGLVGAIIGGAASWLANWQQLGHARSEAERERKHALKHKVYMEAAEGVAAGSKFLMSFCNAEMTIQQLSEMSRASTAWSYRVHSVANLDTIKALDLAAEALSSHGMELMRKKVELDSLQAEAKGLQERLSQLASRTPYLAATFEAASASDAAPETRALAPQLAQDFLNAQVEFSEADRTRAEVFNRLYRAQRALVLSAMKAATDYGKHLSQALIYIRRELGLPIDEDGYLTHVEQITDRGLKRLQDIVDQLDAS